MEEKTYEIGGKKFVQRKLVWGQAKQLRKELESVSLPPSFSVKEIVDLFEDKLPKLISIVLIPEGGEVRTKNNDEMRELFEWDLKIETAVEVVEDFFVCNPIPSWLDKIGTGMQGMMSNSVKSSVTETGSTEMLQSSQEVTSQNETV